MAKNQYGNFDKNFDLVNHQISDEFVTEILIYLQKYHILTELNASFLTVPDPTEDDTVQQIVSQLNKKATASKYSAGAPFVLLEGTLKCIYDETISDQLFEIASQLLSNTD